MSRIRVLSFSILATIACCSCQEQPEYVPTQAEWEYAVEALGERELGGCQHFIDPEGAKYTVDYFVSRGKWYAVVISVRGGASGAKGMVQSYVGFLEEGNTRFTRVDTTKILADEFASRYADLVASDSCWTLISSTQDWTEESLETLWKVAIIDTIVFGEPWTIYSEIDLDLKRQLEARDSISD